MSILTKASVVVLALLVIIACPVFISQATVMPKYRDLFEQEQEKNKGLVQQLTKSKQDATAAWIECGKVTTQAKTVASANSALLAGLQGDKGTLKVEVAKLQATVDSMNVDAQQKDINVKDANDRSARLAKQAEKDRTEINRMRESLARVSRLNDDLARKLGGAEKIARAHAETISELNGEIVDMKKKLANPAGATLAGDTPKAEPNIEGNVLAVSDATVSIDVGSARGIVKDMELVISRGGQLVGYLRITDIDEQNSAGTVTDTQGLDVKVGDVVRTKTALAGG